MENKVNVAEILKHCPSGMELNSPAYSNLYFDNVVDSDSYPIKCFTSYNGMLNTVFLTKYGEIRREENAKCVIFPKDKTTWEGFEPCEFKDGDIIFTCARFSGICSDYLITGLYYTWISIFHEMHKNQVITYVDIENSGRYFPFWMRKGELCRKNDILYQRLATEEEKERLFKYIKDNGYKWNAETKTLEELVEPKFKVGDRVKRKNVNYTHIVTISEIDGDYYGCVNEGGEYSNIYVKSAQDNWELVPDEIEPKFKDGDILYVESVYPFIVIYKENENEECECFYKYVAIKDYPDCTHIFDGNGPLCHKKGVSKIRFATKEEKQKLFQVIEAKGYKWNDETKTLDKLVKSKFEISTLVPFESRVLVRHTKDEIWKPAIFGCYNGYRYYVLGDVYWKYCIPYEGNEHLCGKTDDCDEYYKTWE